MMEDYFVQFGLIYKHMTQQSVASRVIIFHLVS